MEEWKEYKLGDFMEFNPKISLKKNTVARKITMDQLVPHSRDIYSWTYEPYSGGAKFQNGDTIMARITPCLENGKHAFISLLEENEIAYGSTEYIVIRGRCGISDNRFVYYLTHYPSFKEAAVKSMVGSSGRQRAQVDVLENLTMKLPAIPEQRRIAEALSILDDKIKVNKRINDNFVIDSFCQILLIWMLTTLINDNLEQQAQALFKSWFVDFEPFRDQSFVESELGMIPDGWRVVALDELCSFISRGLTPKYDERSDELILGQTCVRNNIVTLDNARKHKPKQKTEKWVQQWDTLINSTGVGSLGRVGIVYFNMDNVAIDSHITVVRPKTALLRHFVGRNLLSRQLEIENMAVGSTGQTELPKDRVKYLPIIMPDENALKHFNAVIEPIARLLYRNIEESRCLASLRDILLPRLMSGEIKVNDLIA
jgi:type I restriction enzyme S subunit